MCPATAKLVGLLNDLVDLTQDRKHSRKVALEQWKSIITLFFTSKADQDRISGTKTKHRQIGWMKTRKQQCRRFLATLNMLKNDYTFAQQNTTLMILSCPGSLAYFKLGIAYLSLALPHCALNSPTFVPLLGAMINHLRPLMPHLIQEQALLAFPMWNKFPCIPCLILYYGFNWGQSCCLPCLHVVLELASIPPTPALRLVKSGLLLRDAYSFTFLIPCLQIHSLLLQESQGKQRDSDSFVGEGSRSSSFSTYQPLSRFFSGSTSSLYQLLWFPSRMRISISLGLQPSNRTHIQSLK